MGGNRGKGERKGGRGGLGRLRRGVKGAAVQGRMGGEDRNTEDEGK